MKTFKEKNGFTLIELLAVIVVLAIVMVIATTTVLPYLSNARKDAFAIEVNSAIRSASQAMSLMAIDAVDPGTEGNDYKIDTSTEGETKTCLTIKKLVELGIYDKDSGDLGKTGYEGRVVVTNKKDSRSYTYSVKMHNASLKVEKTGGDASSSDINNYTSSESDTYDCSSF